MGVTAAGGGNWSNGFVRDLGDVNTDVLFGILLPTDGWYPDIKGDLPSSLSPPWTCPHRQSMCFLGELTKVIRLDSKLLYPEPSHCPSGLL